MGQYKILPSGITVPVGPKPMDETEFRRILRDEGIANRRVIDELWKEAAPHVAKLNERVVRHAARLTIRRRPDIKKRTF